jgi:predicted ATPase
MRLVTLEVEGYRSLAHIIVPLRSPMVMIGPNGSGKTAVLEVFTLLRAAVQEQLGEAISARGGINDLLFAGGAKVLRIRVVATEEAHPALDYTLEIAPRGVGYTIAREHLTQQRDATKAAPHFHIQSVPGRPRYFDPNTGKLERPTWDYKESETALGQVPRMFREPAEFRGLLQGTVLFHDLDVSGRSVVRLPQDLTPVSLPGPNGEHLYAALYNLRANDEPAFERIQEALRAAFPGFRKLEFPIVAMGKATLAWHETGFDRPFYPNQLSEGTLRFVWLATVLLSPILPPITLIDGPDVSLHPELLKILAGLIREASLRTQLIVATHADRLIRWLEPSEVVVVDKEDNRSQFTWADTLNLGDWLAKYTLDELWLMGELGGRP